MNRLHAAKRVSLDEATLRAWEEMRIEILHEIQEGGSVPDELVDAVGGLIVMCNPWSLAEPPAVHTSRIHVN